MKKFHLEKIQTRLRATTKVSNKQIRDRLHIFSRQLLREFRQPVPLFVIVLDGAFRFAADTLRHLEKWMPVEIAFVKASSYQDTYPCSLEFNPLDLDASRVAGREVLIFEDIIDQGNTIKKVSDYILTLEPATVQIATMINKKSRRIVEPDICVKYVLHPELDGDFYVGYGMDFKHLFRTMNHISVLTDDIRKEVLDLSAELE
jgi:hypoxanthine phosphoribosyltransferase